VKNNSPNPSWQPNDKISSPLGDTFQTLNPSNISTQEVYRILIDTIIPRPIALVSTQSKQGKNNLAPFSFFNALSSNPATLMISIGVKPDGSSKDTLDNIIETGEFVVNSANRWLIEPLVYSAGNFAKEVDEMQLVGLTPIASEVVKAPRVKESSTQFECTLYKEVKIGDGSAGSSTMIIGKIERIHLSTALVKNDRIDPKKIETIARLGGVSYAKLGVCFEIKIPKV
jgi:flavin reductase (DIM6/NTAB) family NADH-FMN oxidoreductase RutF